MGSCTSKNEGPFYALWTVLVNLQTGYTVWPLLKSSLWITLSLWLFEGTVGLWGEIEKKRKENLFRNREFLWMCVSEMQFPARSSALLVTHRYFSRTCASFAEHCFCILSSAPILTDAGRSMAVGPGVPVGKGSWVWLEMFTSVPLGRWHCITVLVHIPSDKYIHRITSLCTHLT